MSRSVVTETSAGHAQCRTLVGPCMSAVNRRCMLKHRANPLSSYRLKDAETVVVEPETQAAKAIVPAGTWSADPAHSSVEFKVKHPAMFATVTGRFAKFEASVEA